MTCGDEMAAMLSRYVDGELAPEERAVVDEHLAGCEPCRELLSLFQKNDNLLSSALSTESFGNVVIESVMRSIKGEGTPPEAKPVEPSLWERLRERPLIPLAAAALLMVAAAVFLATSQVGQHADLRELVTQLKAESAELRQTHAEKQEEYEKAVQDLAIRLAFRDVNEFSMFAYMGLNHHLVVRANFDPKAYKSYSVFRRDEDKGDDTYVQLNAEDLKEPVFMDTTAKGGKGYVYKFRAAREDGSTAESAPMLMRALIIPEGSMKIHCTKIAAPKDLAVFEIEKTINGKPVKEEFIVRLNQLIGGVRNVPDAGPVDFSTGYVLDKIEEGLQWIEVALTGPMTDDKGRPILKWVGPNSYVPATSTIRQDNPIATRVNRRAILKPAPGTPPDREEIRIWQGARVWARVR